MLKEFKEFAMKGPVVDLAVGVIIGAAFGKIITSLVKISSCHRSGGCWVTLILRICLSIWRRKIMAAPRTAIPLPASLDTAFECFSGAPETGRARLAPSVAQHR